jgi:FAD/FMN-containing dehydrogenase
MLEVFPQDTINRLRTLKKRVDPDNVFKMGAWQYEANK